MNNILREYYNRTKQKNSSYLRYRVNIVLVILSCLLLSGCDNKPDNIKTDTVSVQNEAKSNEEKDSVYDEMDSADDTSEEAITEEIMQEATGTIEEVTSEEAVEEENPYEQYIVAIDAGHQRYGNSEQEPIGPGAAQTKAKVTGGTSGVASGMAEYELNLIVAQKLRDRLTAMGYQVVMVRESHDVDISNSERAAIANNAGADVFLRIHANGSENPASNGILTMCQTSANPYCGQYYEDSYRLAGCLLDAMVASTGANSCGISQVDNMSGINWCQVPVTIIEMGFMTNYEEDLKLASEDYQNLIVDGIVSGLDKYFGIEK